MTLLELDIQDKPGRSEYIKLKQEIKHTVQERKHSYFSAFFPCDIDEDCDL